MRLAVSVYGHSLYISLIFVILRPVNIRGRITAFGPDSTRARGTLKLRFSPADGVIEVILTVQGDEASLRVRDHGPGVRPDDLARIDVTNAKLLKSRKFTR